MFKKKKKTYLQALGVGFHSLFLQVSNKSVTESRTDHVPYAKHSDEHTCEQKQTMDQ